MCANTGLFKGVLNPPYSLCTVLFKFSIHGLLRASLRTLKTFPDNPFLSHPLLTAEKERSVAETNQTLSLQLQKAEVLQGFFQDLGQGGQNGNM